MFKKVFEKLKNRKFLVVVLLLFFAVNIFSIINTFSEKTTSSVWDGKVATKFKSGSGTALDPYIIDNGGQLAYFFTLINGEDSGEYFNKFYSITNNIDLNGYSLSYAAFNKSFSGNLDGNGYTIFNFVLDGYYFNEDETTAHYSLFDSLYGANIKNINFSDITLLVDTKKIEKTTKEEEVIENKDTIEEVKDEPKEEIKEEEKTELPKEEVKDTAGLFKKYNIKLVNETEGENTENNTTTPTENNENTTENPTEPVNNENTQNNENNENNDNTGNTGNDNTENEIPTVEEPKEEPKTEEEPKKEEVVEEPKTDTIEEETTEEEPEETPEEEPKEEVVEEEFNVTISLFRDVKQSHIENISINDIEIDYRGNKDNVDSSLFILNDVENNTIENININGKSNLKSTYVLIANYNEATLDNILFTTDNLRFVKGYEIEEDTRIYQYYIQDNHLSFYEEYSTKAILNGLSNNSTLRWKLQNNQFKIVNSGVDAPKLKAAKLRRAAPNAHVSGTEGTVVYVNDYAADANYYQGLNYTYSANNNYIPTTESKNIYGDSNLVYVQINYFGSDYAGDYIGRLSPSENFNQFVYYKVYPVDNGYVDIELIDNPWSRRPDNKTFNGWVTNYEGAEVYLDTDLYIWHAKVPVTTTSGQPDNISMNVYSVWNNGKITNYSSSWANTFSNLDDNGFHAISSNTVTYEDIAPYYVRATVNNNSWYGQNDYDYYGNSLYGGRCTGGSCTVYRHPTGNYVQGTQYYKLETTMVPYNIAQITTYNSEIPVGDSIAGYYRRANLTSGTPLSGYYNTSGELLTSGTASNNGTYYELIQFYDANGNNEEKVVEGTIYYYKTTRDTNIVVMTANITGAWGSSQDKPLTLTSTNNNSNYISSSYLNLNGRYVTCYDDTRMENMRIYSNVSLQNDNTTPSSNNTGATLIGNNYNVKIGRGMSANATNRATLRYAIGSSTSGTGSSSNPTRYTFVIESGVYNTLGLVTRAGGSGSYYVNAFGVFGNDFDRVTENNSATTSNMIVRYSTSASWSSNIYGRNNNDTSMQTTIKSGIYGYNKYDIYSGVYVGARAGGNLYSKRAAIIEGGYIYNLIGGPLSNKNNNNTYNDTFIAMKGGSVDVIIGGAGQTGTVNNKVIQVTGGTVNYAVFGGSNGVEGQSGQTGAIDGDTYVYVGGNAEIGTEALVNANATESRSLVEAGSVFGIGNGKSGSSTIGTVNNSYVVIDGAAVVRKNVYGGGNYGATGQNGTNQTYETKIKIAGGTINGSVYGGGNNNGAGKADEEITNWWGQVTGTEPGNTTNITIEMTSGTVNGSVYGGSRTEGIVYGSTAINIIGGSVLTDVYGGGEGGYQNTNNFGTSVRDNVDIVIGNSSSGPTINGSVYGGSAYGTVNGIKEDATNPSADSTKHVNVTVHNGNVVDSVFGGAKGSSTYTPYVAGKIAVNVDGGTVGSVFGGFDEAGTPLVTDSGTNYADVVTIEGSSIVTSVYGGGNKTSLANTHVNIKGGTITTAFGGSNESGTVNNTYVTVTGGTTTTIYGGNNEGGTCTTTHVTINNGATVTNVYGGGNLVETTTTNVEVNGNSGTITNIYGGGNNAGATTTNVYLQGSSVNATNVFGGSNESGTVTNSYVALDNGHVTNLYGGNNAGGQTNTTHVTVNGGVPTIVYGGGNEAISGTTNVTINDTDSAINTIYGGGNKAACTTTNVTINKTTGTFTNVYGGGNSAGATTTNVTTTAANVNITNVFGGSNITGTVETSNVNIQNGNITSVYGGNNAGGNTEDANVTVTTGTIGTVFGGGNEAVTGDTTVVINNGNITTIYGGGNKADCDNTSVTVNNASSAISNVFGGGNSAGADSTTVVIGSSGGPNISIGGVYGGSNTTGDVDESNVTINSGTITSLYGGNNAGGETDDANLVVNGGTMTNIFGGGNEAETGSTVVTINAGSATNVYGGGNAAGVTGNTSLTTLGGSVSHNIYGGGNEGEVGGNTNVLIHNTTVNGSAYAGGNGSTAIVHGNTSITVSGTTVVGTQSCSNPSTCSVFGGGNAAATGTETNNNSVASVKITGATIYGNVYGGANTSKIFGETNVNIGADVPTGTNITRGTIQINGTVFGGGEANASGSTTYDFSFISVTQGVLVNINGQNYNNFSIDGSIFGSGNASSSEGESYIYIKNYGSMANPQYNISIQRADLVEINNSAIVLAGATDRTNDWADVLFSVSRVSELDLKNNAVIFMENGANLLKDFKSLDATGDPASVTIGENGITNRTTDNRLYIYAGRHLDIAKDQNATDMGDVTGMTFFGMFKYNGDDTVNVGMYEEVDDGDDVEWAKVFDNVTSYVAGLHKTNHNIEVDGFYTNFADEQTQKYNVDYIEPTPPTGPLYMWIIGAGVIEYELDLTASRYSTLGTSELQLRDFTNPNTTFAILGFDYSELAAGVSLINKSEVKKIADSGTEADNVMGVSFETSNTGWLLNGQTSFVTNDPDDPVKGTDSYVKGNTSGAPTLLVYLHHSKNIATAGDMGTVRIQMMSIRQINALDKETKRLIVTLNLSRVLIDSNTYEGAMTPGRKYELFASTTTNISSTSSLSAFYSFFKTGTEIYKTGYHRTLVSTFVFPLNTKITMIDLSQNTPEYYYKVINSTDVANAQTEFTNVGEVSYNLSMFEAMGAENSGVYYDDVAKNALYYNTSQQFANEEFIFIIDFGDTNITTDQLQNKLLIEMRNASDATIYSVFAPQHDALTYNVYADKDAIIQMDGEISSNKIYNGDSFTTDIQIDYTQSSVGSTVIYDTHYFDSKLGIKISLLNDQGQVVTGTTLLGLYYIIDEVRYDPNIDGTTRIKIADKVDDAEKWIIVNTGTSSIATGDYTLRIESFGSPDGIYYGLESSDYVDFEIEIINEIYGLNVTTTAEEMSINKDTGLNENGENEINYTVSYNSGLNDPNIRFKLFRRNYATIDDTTYSLVDAADYFTNELTPSGITNEYMVSDDPGESFNVTYTTGEDLVSGTYKMQFILYDDTAVIGTVDKYFIIK